MGAQRRTYAGVMDVLTAEGWRNFQPPEATLERRVGRALQDVVPLLRGASGAVQWVREDPIEARHAGSAARHTCALLLPGATQVRLNVRLERSCADERRWVECAQFLT